MNELLDRLLEALQEETRFQKDLVDLGGDKQHALVDANIAEVDRLNAAEQGVLLALAHVAARRLRLMRDVAAWLGLKEEEVRASVLAARLPEPYGTKVGEIVRSLKALMKRVERTTAANRALTEQSLKLVNDFFLVLGGAGEQGVTYTRRGLDRPRIQPYAVVDHVA